MKTADLVGLPLDWAVVRCECDIPAQFVSIPARLNGSVRVFRKDINAYSEPISPSTDWAQGGPIIELGGINIIQSGSWLAEMNADHSGGVIRSEGPTPLIAAMRCYVASKLGDEVEIPEGLT